jgi:hypothetical protein
MPRVIMVVIMVVIMAIMLSLFGITHTFGITRTIILNIS